MTHLHDIDRDILYASVSFWLSSHLRTNTNSSCVLVLSMFPKENVIANIKKYPYILYRIIASLDEIRKPMQFMCWKFEHQTQSTLKTCTLRLFSFTLR